MRNILDKIIPSIQNLIQKHDSINIQFKNKVDEDDRSLKGFSINLDALPSKRLEIS